MRLHLVHSMESIAQPHHYENISKVLVGNRYFSYCLSQIKGKAFFLRGFEPNGPHANPCRFSCSFRARR